MNKCYFQQYSGYLGSLMGVLFTIHTFLSEFSVYFEVMLLPFFLSSDSIHNLETAIFVSFFTIKHPNYGCPYTVKLDHNLTKWFFPPLFQKQYNRSFIARRRRRTIRAKINFHVQSFMFFFWEGVLVKQR